MDGGGGGGGRHASLMRDPGSNLPLRETNLTGQKVNYLDSGYSEEGNDNNGGIVGGDQQITSCLMKTSSGSIYIPGSRAQHTHVVLAVLSLH